MSLVKKEAEKPRLHVRNKNKDRYDLGALILLIPALKKYVVPNKSGEDSINFSNPLAVRLINKAILNHYYSIQYWEFPDENLCPPIPGRADYIHHVADLLSSCNSGIIPRGDIITCLDVGVGASCIYPIIGVTEYGWNFIGSDIDHKSLACAKKIVGANIPLTSKVKLRLQKNPTHFFQGIIDKEEKIDLTICNPPFHATKKDAQKANIRKVKNLSEKSGTSPLLNFSGIHKELIYNGGEITFIKHMIKESKQHAKNIYWFSTLVSKQSNIKPILSFLKSFGTAQYKLIPMGTANKSSRIIAWTFLSKREQKEWSKSRWQHILTN